MMMKKRAWARPGFGRRARGQARGTMTTAWARPGFGRWARGQARDETGQGGQPTGAAADDARERLSFLRPGGPIDAGSGPREGPARWCFLRFYCKYKDNAANWTGLVLLLPGRLWVRVETCRRARVRWLCAPWCPRCPCRDPREGLTGPVVFSFLGDGGREFWSTGGGWLLLVRSERWGPCEGPGLWDRQQGQRRP